MNALLVNGLFLNSDYFSIEDLGGTPHRSDDWKKAPRGLVGKGKVDPEYRKAWIVCEQLLGQLRMARSLLNTVQRGIARKGYQEERFRGARAAVLGLMDRLNQKLDAAEDARMRLQSRKQQAWSETECGFNGDGRSGSVTQKQEHETRSIMSAGFAPAVRKQNKLRFGLAGPSGSGKTMTALRLGLALARHSAKLLGRKPRVACICSEHGTCKKYVGDVYDGHAIEFEDVVLRTFSPTTYTEYIKLAGKGGYDVCIVDSLSHAWNGTDGALEQVSRKGGNSFTAWKDVTPQHNALINAICSSPCHMICTMRSKMEYVLETDEKGKQVPKKVGMEPIQREGMIYEFDIFAELDLTQTLKVEKSRCSALKNAICHEPGETFMIPVIEWLYSGEAITDEMLEDAEITFGREMDASTSAGQSVNGNGSGGAAPSIQELMRQKAAGNGSTNASVSGSSSDAGATKTSSPGGPAPADSTTAGKAEITQSAKTASPAETPASKTARESQSAPAAGVAGSQGSTGQGSVEKPKGATREKKSAEPKIEMITPKLMQDIRHVMDWLQMPPEQRVAAYGRRLFQDAPGGRPCVALDELTLDQAEVFYQALVQKKGQRLAASNPSPGGPKDQKETAANGSKKSATTGAGTGAASGDTT